MQLITVSQLALVVALIAGILDRIQRPTEAPGNDPWFLSMVFFAFLASHVT